MCVHVCFMVLQMTSAVLIQCSVPSPGQFVLVTTVLRLLKAWDSVTVVELQWFYVYTHRKLYAENSHKFSLQSFAPHKLTLIIIIIRREGGRKSCRGRCVHENWCPSNCIVSPNSMSNYNCSNVKRHCSGASDVMSVVEQWWSLQTLTGNQQQQQLLKRSASWVGPAANCATFLPAFINCRILCSLSMRWDVIMLLINWLVFICS